MKCRAMARIAVNGKPKPRFRPVPPTAPGWSELTTTQRVIEAIIAKTEKGADPIDPLLLLLRSAPNPRAAEILRESIARHFERPLKSLLMGPSASERAAIILAFISGLQLFRKVIGSKALTDGPRAGFYANVEATFQRLIDHD